MTANSMISPSWPCVIGIFKGYAPIYQGVIGDLFFKVEFVHGKGWCGFKKLENYPTFGRVVGPFDSPQEACAAIVEYTKGTTK